jgi:quercetin dioxygenase-like cupin family protein
VALIVFLASIACQSEPTPTVEQDKKETVETTQPILLEPQDLQWKDAPSLPPGTQVAVLEGDPSKEGPFAQRIRFPDGARIQPHTHPNLEHVLVLEGTFYLGLEDTFIEETAQAYPAGSFVVLPPNTKHFAFVRGDTILQTHGIGPFAINYLEKKSETKK